MLLAIGANGRTRLALKPTITQTWPDISGNTLNTRPHQTWGLTQVCSCTATAASSRYSGPSGGIIQRWIGGCVAEYSDESGELVRRFDFASPGLGTTDRSAAAAEIADT